MKTYTYIHTYVATCLENKWSLCDTTCKLATLTAIILLHSKFGHGFPNITHTMLTTVIYYLFILFMSWIRCIAIFIVRLISAILVSPTVIDAFCDSTVSFCSLFSFSNSLIFFSSSLCWLALTAAVAASLDYRNSYSTN